MRSTESEDSVFSEKRSFNLAIEERDIQTVCAKRVAGIVCKLLPALD